MNLPSSLGRDENGFFYTMSMLWTILTSASFASIQLNTRLLPLLDRIDVQLSPFPMQGGTVAKLLQTWSEISRSEAYLPHFVRLTAALADFSSFCSSVVS